MGKNRDRLSIVADVLESVGSGSSKTRIMFAANLSFNLLEKYLDVVVRAGFVESRDAKYMLSDRGWEFLNNYKQFHTKYTNAQKLLENLGNEREKLALKLVI